MADVFLHVGLAKTGTTTIQAALEAQAARLGDAGVLFAGGRHRAQRLAVYDLLGQRVQGDDKEIVAGKFRELVAEMTAYDGRSVVVSEEELSLARPRHVRRLVRALGDRRVVVVIGVRDLARTLVSAWQQAVVTGGVTPWPAFIGSVRGDARAPTGDGVSFWLRQDVLRVIDTWTTVIPADRIRVVTVPASGADDRVLLERFARAAELPLQAWRPEAVRPRNVSLGCAEIELVRRLNAAVGGRLNRAQYRFVIEAGIRQRLEVPASRPLRLPAEHLPWAREHGEWVAQELRRRGVQVVGDGSELVPAVTASTAVPLDVVDDSELLAAAEAALASLALAHGVLFKRYRRAFVSQEGRWPGAAEVAGSRARAAWFGAQRTALRHADRNRLLARAARGYLSHLGRVRRP